MTGLGGDICFEGERAGTALDCLAGPLEAWGQRESRWRSGNFGLVVRTRATTPWNEGDEEPVVRSTCETGAFLLAASARLDDRAGLADALGIAPEQVSGVSDTTLLGRAYSRWGKELVDRVLGDWVCVVWEPDQARLWIGRDAAGNTGLFYWSRGSRLVFSTSLRAVLAHPWVSARPNQRRLARQLAVIPDRADPMSTVFEDICSLPGGFDLVADRTGPRTRRWWRPESLTPWSGGDDELRHRFLATLRCATEDRLPVPAGAPGVFLSGGLDSGAVTALAAARRQDLRAYTAAPAWAPTGAGPTREGDERVAAQATAAFAGIAGRWRAVTDSGSVIESLVTIQQLHCRPLHAAANYGWIRAGLSAAAEDGVWAMLTGQGGNGTISRDSQPWLNGLRRWRYWMRTRSRPEPGTEVPPLSPIRAEWARTLALRYRALTPAEQRAHGDDIRLGRLGSAALGSLWMEIGALSGVEVRDPTRDRRVIECCWRIPDALCRDRGLVRTTFRGLLPEAVLTSGRRGQQSADLGHRLVRDRERVLALIERFEGHSLAREWLNLTLLRRVQADLDGGVTPANSHLALTVLLRGLDAGLFLARF